MAFRTLPSQAYLLNRLKHDPETGLLFWRTRPIEDFDDRTGRAERSWKIWNGKHANQPAFHTLNPDGYYQGVIAYQHHLTHRIVWKITTGEDPEYIDHINGVRTDNRSGNLRSVTRSENQRNHKLHSSNNSGVCGVFWDAYVARWRATGELNGRKHYIGVFVSIEDAADARKAWQEKHGFSQRHGT